MNANVKHIDCTGEPAVLSEICQKILLEAKSCEFDDDILFGLHLAIEEAFVNAVKHGNHGDETQKVYIEYNVSPEKVEIQISDQGKGFSPEKVPDPRCGDNVYKTGGRGILLMRAYMDHVEYNKTGNSVFMVKYRENTSDRMKKRQ